jgi:hypothetical protein
MTGTERRFLKIWIALTVLAGIALYLSWVASLLIVVIVTAPLGILLVWTPTIWLYLTPAFVLYALLRLALRKRPVPRWAMAVVACAVVAGAGFTIPTLANREIEARADRIMAADMGEEPMIAPVESIALLVERRSFYPRCSEQCQRLLFSGLATAVVQGSLDALAGPAVARERVVRHRIVPIATGCDNRLLQASHADRSEFKGAYPAPLLWEKLDDLAKAGRCFRSDWSNDARADLYLVHDYGYRGDPSAAPRFDFRLVKFAAPQFCAVWRRDGDRLVPVLRRTRLTVRKLQVPLAVDPPDEFPFGFTPGGWKFGTPEQRGREPIAGLMRPWLRNDLRLSGLGRDRPPEIVIGGERPRD